MRVIVDPAQKGSFSSYVGRGKKIEVRFRNENQDRDVQVFPEAPLVIRNVQAGKDCRVVDGGIWARKEVYLSHDEATLLVRETSGSNDWLAFYDTMTCAKKSEVDISGSNWGLDANRIVVGSQCTGDGIERCASRRFVSLDSGCAPAGKSRK